MSDTNAVTASQIIDADRELRSAGYDPILLLVGPDRPLADINDSVYDGLDVSCLYRAQVTDPIDLVMIGIRDDDSMAVTR